MNTADTTPAIADVEILGPGSETIGHYRARIDGPETDQALISRAIQHRAYRGLDYQHLLPLLSGAEAHYLNVTLGLGRDPEEA